MAFAVIRLKKLYLIMLVVTFITLHFIDLKTVNGEQKNELNEVKILSPQNGDDVGNKIVVKGTSKVKDGSSVWVLVHLRLLTDQWWPQPKPLVQPNGDWEALAYIGQPDDVGFDFEIAVATFDKEAEKEILAYHEAGMKTEKWLPIKFPETTSNIDIVTVKKVK
jgi:hypothetical protein